MPTFSEAQCSNMVFQFYPRTLQYWGKIFFCALHTIFLYHKENYFFFFFLNTSIDSTWFRGRPQAILKGNVCVGLNLLIMFPQIGLFQSLGFWLWNVDDTDLHHSCTSNPDIAQKVLHKSEYLKGLIAVITQLKPLFFLMYWM